MGKRAMVIAGVLMLLTATPLLAAADYRFVDLHHPQFAWDNVTGGAAGRAIGNIEVIETGQSRAVLWDLSGAVVDLHPAGAYHSGGIGMTATHQVGYTVDPTDGYARATLWTGSADSAVSLHPAGSRTSTAWAVAGTQQVGVVELGLDTAHAVLWSGTADSVVDLHPTGYTNSQANAASLTSQGGSAVTASNQTRAMLWHGTAASAVDLHPNVSVANSGLSDVTDELQVGDVWGSAPGQERASLWRGSAASYVSLHPAGYTRSHVHAAHGTQQVGYVARPGGVGDAFDPILWNSSATDFVLLRQFMPDQYFDAFAVAIDEDGTIFGQAQTNNPETGSPEFHVVAWVVPEPSAGAVVGVAAALHTLAFRRRRR